MHLLQNEQILLESDAKTLRLTTHRVRYHSTSWGSADLVSIMLEEVSSCGMLHRSFPILLGLAGLALVLFLGGQFGGQQAASAGISGPEIRAGAILGAILFVILYFATRFHVLSIRSAGDAIRIRMSGMTTERVMHFIEQIEAAKNARLLRLTAVSSVVASPPSGVPVGTIAGTCSRALV
jgi:hypothetical protein